MDKIQNIRGVLLFEGILFILLGMAAIAVPGIFTLGIELLLGWIFLIGGVIQLYRSFKSRNGSGFVPSILTALFYIIFGVLLLAFPITGIVSLTILISAAFLIDGLGKTALAIQARPFEGWGWILFSGLLSLAMALIIISGLPGTAAWVIGLLVGINMLFFGFSLLAIRSAAKA